MTLRVARWSHLNNKTVLHCSSSVTGTTKLYFTIQVVSHVLYCYYQTKAIHSLWGFFSIFFLRPSFLDLADCIKEISVVRLCILDLLFRIPIFRRKKCKIQSLTQQPEVDLSVAAEYEIPVEGGVKRTAHYQRQQTDDSKNSDSSPFYHHLQHMMFTASLCGKTYCSCII